MTEAPRILQYSVRQRCIPTPGLLYVPSSLLCPYGLGFCLLVPTPLPPFLSCQHSLSPLQRTCSSPPVLSFFSFFSSSSRVSFLKSCPGRLGRTKTFLHVCIYTILCNIPHSGAAETHHPSVQSKNIRSGRAHTLGDMQGPTTEAGKQQQSGTETTSGSTPASQEIPCHTVSVHNPVPWRVQAWEIS